MTDERFSAALRLRTRNDFQRVFETGRALSDGTIVVHACRNGLGHSRLGLMISRRVGGAIERNRWKRVVREAFRKHRTELPPSLDLIVLAKRTRPPTIDEAAQAMTSLTRRLERKLPAAGREKS